LQGWSPKTEKSTEKVDCAARDGLSRQDYPSGKCSQRQLSGMYGVGEPRIHEILPAVVRTVDLGRITGQLETYYGASPLDFQTQTVDAMST